MAAVLSYHQQLGFYFKTICHLQREGKLSDDTTHQTCKYLNNVVEDHGALKQIIRPTRVFAADISILLHVCKSAVEI